MKVVEENQDLAHACFNMAHLKNHTSIGGNSDFELDEENFKLEQEEK